MTKRDLVSAEFVERRILSIRGVSVIIDADLAELYGVETGRLNEQVKRNRERFLDDLVFQLTQEEFGSLRSQSAISNTGCGGRRSRPYAFTEHGAILWPGCPSGQLERNLQFLLERFRERAIEMSVFVVRAFVKLKGILASQVEMLQKLEELEDKVGEHDEALRSIVEAIRRLMAPPARTPRIGFEVGGRKGPMTAFGRWR